MFQNMLIKLLMLIAQKNFKIKNKKKKTLSSLEL